VADVALNTYIYIYISISIEKERERERERGRERDHIGNSNLVLGQSATYPIPVAGVALSLVARAAGVAGGAKVEAICTCESCARSAAFSEP